MSYKGQDKLRNLGGLRSELAEKLELPFSRILRSQTTLVICSHLSGGRVEMGVGWGEEVWDGEHLGGRLGGR